MRLSIAQGEVAHLTGPTHMSRVLRTVPVSAPRRQGFRAREGLLAVEGILRIAGLDGEMGG